MSVFTEVDASELRAFLAGYPLGALQQYRATSEGTDNTNYFLETERGRYVLTLLERVDDATSEYAAALATHLAARGLPCAAAVPRDNGSVFGTLCGKRALIVPCLPGRSLATPTPADCATAGKLLAQLHLAAQDFSLHRANAFTDAWLQQSLQQLATHVSATQRELLDEQTRATGALNEILPRGVIHADLFRDNVLFTEGQITGVLDWYYACTDDWLLDVAIAVNDWCWRDQELLTARVTAFCAAYHQQRNFTDSERRCWPLLLRKAALRFWVSRLLDQHYPRSARGMATKPAPEMESRLRYYCGNAVPPLP